MMHLHISGPRFFIGEEVQMTKQLILQKTEKQRIKIRLVYHNSYRFRVTLVHETIYFVIQKAFGKMKNPAGNLTKHVSLKSKWCCLEITLEQKKNKCQKLTWNRLSRAHRKLTRFE
jgi:hypothetical protein